MAEKHLINVDGSIFEAELERSRVGSSALRLRFNSEAEWRTVELQHVRAGLHVLTIDNRPLEIYVERQGRVVVVTIGRTTYHAHVGHSRSEFTSSVASTLGSDGVVKVTAPMTGSVIEVRARVGATVEVGDVLAVIESMKMNNELRSPVAGIVGEVAISNGEQVEKDDQVMLLQIPEDQTEA